MLLRATYVNIETEHKCHFQLLIRVMFTSRASQMNSYAGKTKESLFITFSFDHVHEHKPKECSIEPHKATLDKYQFSDVEQEEMKRKEADMIRKHKHGNETHTGHGEEEDHDHVHEGEMELEQVENTETTL